MRVVCTAALLSAACLAHAQTGMQVNFDAGLPRGWQSIGMPTLTEGREGRAVLIDRNDALMLPAPELLTGGFDIAMWVMHPVDLRDLHFEELVYLYHDTEDMKNRICLKKRIGTDEIVFAMSDGTGDGKGAEFAGDWYAMTSGPLAWEAGTWHHLRIVADPASGRAALVIDGDEVASAGGTQFPERPGTLWLGSWSGRSQARAAIDELSVGPVEE